MTQRRLFLTAALLVFLPGVGFAQDPSHWGIVGSVTPTWKVPSQLEELFEGTVDIKGTDFSVGIARGKSRSGDWGVSFIHKKFKDGSRVEGIEEDCASFSNGCFLDGESFTTRGVAINGLEVHKFIPFVRIRDRVQIGMNVAGGFGKFTGMLDKREFSAEPVTFPPGGGRPTGRQTETSSTEPAKELIDIPVFPIFKLQASVAVIASPAFKLRFQGGIDLPGYEFISVAAVYLIGAK
jgi:hypothetical protein